MFKTSQFADVTLCLKDGTEVKAHKSVLSRCDFFRAALSGSFKVNPCLVGLVSTWLTYNKESQESKITFPEDPALAMQALIMNLYGHSITEWQAAKMPEKWPTLSIINIHKVAIKYNLPDLAAEAVKYCGTMLKSNFASNLEPDKHWLWAFAKSLYRDETTAPLIVELLTVIRNNRAALLVLDKAAMRKAFTECPELATDLLMGGGLLGDARVKWT